MRNVVFSILSYFVFFLSLGFSSFPLQTHLRGTVPASTASLLASLIPVAACGTYFLARFAEGRCLLRFPQRAQFVAAMGFCLMQALLSFALGALANGYSVIGPVFDLAVCLFLMGSMQSCVMTLLNHNAVASLGSLAYTARAAGSAGYMIAVIFMGAVGSQWFDVEKQHLFTGACISAGLCMLSLLGCFVLKADAKEVAVGKQRLEPAHQLSPRDRTKWISLVVLVWLVALCEMSFGIYAHEFLTSRLGSMGYYQFALGVVLEVALLMVIPLVPGVRGRLLFVGPVGWICVFGGCVLGLTVAPGMGWFSLAFCLNCPFQISANEHGHRLKPTVTGIATLTLSQSLGYVTGACLASIMAQLVAANPGFLAMPGPLWMLALPISMVALVLSLRILSGQHPALNVGDFGHSGSVPGGGAVTGVEERLDDFKGDLRTDNTSTDAEDVHVVVFNSLTSRVGVVAKAGADSRELVGSDAYAHSGATNKNPAIDFPTEQHGSDQLRKVREIA
jgi:hypothetical protein